MKKLRLKALSLGAREILNREQLKAISGGCTTDQDCGALLPVCSGGSCVAAGGGTIPSGSSADPTCPSGYYTCFCGLSNMGCLTPDECSHLQCA